MTHRNTRVSTSAYGYVFSQVSQGFRGFDQHLQKRPVRSYKTEDGGSSPSAPTTNRLVSGRFSALRNRDRSRSSPEVRTRSKSSCRVQRKRELRLAGGGSRSFEPATSTQTCRLEARGPACASASPLQVRGRSRRCRDVDRVAARLDGPMRASVAVGERISPVLRSVPLPADASFCAALAQARQAPDRAICAPTTTPGTRNYEGAQLREVALTPIANEGMLNASPDRNGARVGSSAALMASTSSAGSDLTRIARGPATVLCTAQ